jgi:uncharacterized protein (DUF1810 family)
MEGNRFAVLGSPSDERCEVSDRYDLERFVDAQAPVYAQVCSELQQGRKRSHWMWFVFPQIKGLGSSPMAMRFGISSLEEAKAYLEHPVLGPRLRECSRMATEVKGRTVEEIFGYPDDMKFHSSMTLFAQAAEESKVFEDALQKYFGGEMDRSTMERL